MWFKKKKSNDNEIKKPSGNSEMSKLIDEVLEEQAATKEEAMRQSAGESEKEIKKAAHEAAFEAKAQESLHKIDVFLENRTDETFKSALESLMTSAMLVPMTPMTANGAKKKQQFRPELLANPQGEKFLPAFTNKAQVPADYAKKFTLIMMPFAVCCDTASKIPECGKVVVNAFTKQFVVNEKIVSTTVKAMKNAQNQA